MKRETVEEYLARGGKVERCPPHDGKPNNIVYPTGHLDLSELATSEDHQLGSRKARTKKSRPIEMVDIDLSCLPERIRQRLVELSLEYGIGDIDERL